MDLRHPRLDPCNSPRELSECADRVFSRGTSGSNRAMRLRALLFSTQCRTRVDQRKFRIQWRPHRALMTLAIESSCDDTSVAVLEKTSQDEQTAAKLHFHKKVTSDNTIFQGVHPLVSLYSHQKNLARLVNEAIAHLPFKEGSQTTREAAPSFVNLSARRLPDFISVTRGPGMRSNLSTGLDTAKGLAVAWQVMQENPFSTLR